MFNHPLLVDIYNISNFSYISDTIHILHMSLCDQYIWIYFYFSILCYLLLSFW